MTDQPSAPSGAGTIRERLREIRAREQKATKGPWEYTETGDPRVKAVWVPFGSTVADVIANISADCDDDGQFIAHAREDIAWLLDQLEAASALPVDEP